MRRYVRRHADRDPAGAINEHVRISGRQDDRLLHRLVVIGLEIDSFLIDIVEQRFGGRRQAGFRVAHRRRGIAVHRAEIPLPVDQRQAHREILCHPHHRIVDRLIAMGMVSAHHVTDDAGRLAVGLVRIIAVFVHRIEDAPMDRFQPIANVGQGPAHDHAHGVIEIRSLHLLFDRNIVDIEGSFAWWLCAQGVIGRL